MIHAIHIKLKDGRDGIVREVRVEDADGLRDTLLAVTHAGIGVVRLPNERTKYIDDPISAIKDYQPGGEHGGSRGCMIVGEVNGRIVAEGTIRRMSPTRLRHIAHIGLSVHPEFQELGLGRAVMHGLLEWARTIRDPSMPDISRVDLAVFADNVRAVRLYESLGFVREGVRRNFIRYEDGRYEDDLIMALLL